MSAASMFRIVRSDDNIHKDVFMTFIDHYGYAGVKALMEKFDHYERELAAGMKPRLLESRLKVSTAHIARSE